MSLRSGQLIDNLKLALLTFGSSAFACNVFQRLGLTLLVFAFTLSCFFETLALGFEPYGIDQAALIVCAAFPEVT